MNELELGLLLLVVVFGSILFYGFAREIARAGWLPVVCAACSRIVQERHSHRRLLTTWQWVRLCDRCDAALLGTEPENEP